MNEDEPLIPDEIIINKIHLIRGCKVMLDKDLAELYQVTTGNLNKAVERNSKRFPEDFLFQLNQKEFRALIFQNGRSRWGGTRKLPYAFTIDGVSMLSGILTSDLAISMNIRIMRIFSRVQHFLLDHTELRLEIEKIKNHLNNQDKNIELVFRYLDELLEKKYDPAPRKQIGFKTDTD
jgi:ORF6N domain